MARQAASRVRQKRTRGHTFAQGGPQGRVLAMATPAAPDLGLNDGVAPAPEGTGRSGGEPLRSVGRPSGGNLRPLRREAQTSPPKAAGAQRVGLFLKILLGDLTLWFVLSGVLTFEVARSTLDPSHALAGAAAGLLVAVLVSFGLKQVANRVVPLDRGHVRP